MTTQPLLTPHQSQYFAWLLTRRAAGDSVESLASTLVDSQVDLNPHQVEAALFACRNPLSRGVILADEVGLGKTIEAGLVLSVGGHPKLTQLAGYFASKFDPSLIDYPAVV